MSDIYGIVALLTFVYGAAGSGLSVALLLRAWSRRRGHAPSVLEAGWCAFLPLVAVLALPVAAALQPHAAGPLVGLHRLWHGWERGIHAAPFAHGALHVLNLLLLVLVASGAARVVFAFARTRSFAAALRAAARPFPEPVTRRWLYYLPSPQPACFTLGLFHPAVYLTTGLLEHLSPRDREAMLAHEAAHLRRRDGLTRALLAAFYTLLPLPGSRTLQADWERAVERECDAQAARRIGCPYDVAAALVRVARLVGPFAPPRPGAAGFAAPGDDIEGRLQALLALSSEAPAPAARATSPGLLALLSLGLLFAASSGVRHAVELLIRH